MLTRLWCWFFGHDIFIRKYDGSSYEKVMRTHCMRCGEPNKYFAAWYGANAERLGLENETPKE